jgi:hypothetical protein
VSTPKGIDAPPCWHIDLVKQVGTMDGGPAASTRYRCKECGEFIVGKPYSVEVSIGPAPSVEAAIAGMAERITRDLLSDAYEWALAQDYDKHPSLFQAMAEFVRQRLGEKS